MNPNIEIPTKKIAEFCRSWKITEFSLFGSVLREDFRPESDIDVLVTFSADARWSLFDLVDMENELSRLFNRDVDLIEREAVERSPNYIRKKNILRSTQVIYATR